MNFVILWQECVTHIPTNCGMDSVCLDTYPIDGEEFLSRVNYLRSKNLIFHVSLQMRRKLEGLGLYPCILDADYQFDFSFLLQAMGQIGQLSLLLNHNAIILPVGCLATHEMVPARFFIRPNGGGKSFPGQVIEKSDFKIFLNTYRVNFAEMCAIAPVVSFSDETRCFVLPGSKNPLIGLSPYRHHDSSSFDTKPITHQEALDVIRLFAGYNFWPDGVVVDLCRTNGGVRIVEINSISTSGTYRCKGIARSIADHALIF